MNTLFLAAGLLVNPAPAISDAELDTLFHVQQQEVERGIREETRLDLYQRSVRYFAIDGELRELLDEELLADALAAR